MSVLFIFAASGVFYNDVLVIISVLGSIILFLGSFPNSPLRRFIGLAEWCISAVVFGTFFQIAIAVTELEPEQIGFLVPMSAGLVNGLFALSCMLLGGHWWMKRNQSELET